MSTGHIDAPDAGGIRIVEALTHGLRMGEISVRHEVFVTEQRVPPVLEIDARDFDPAVRHLVALDRGGRVIATVRLIPEEGGYHLGRLAVRPRWRGRRVGAALVLAAHDLVAGLTPPGASAAVVLDSQVQARGFYERLGYRAVTGEVFLDAGIEHVTMAREVPGRAPH